MTDKKIVYLLCSGPSLNNLDLTKFKDKSCCMINRSILMHDKLPFEPRYYLINDATNNQKIDMNIINIINKRKFKNTIVVLSSNFWVDGSELISDDAQYNLFTSRVVHFSDSCSISIEYLISIGYREIIIFGLDFNYNGHDYGNLIQDGSQHFSIDGIGIYDNIVWKFPSREAKEKEMNRISNYAKNIGISIFNGTRETKTDSFVKKDYPDFYKKV